MHFDQTAWQKCKAEGLFQMNVINGMNESMNELVNYSLNELISLVS